MEDQQTSEKERSSEATNHVSPDFRPTYANNFRFDKTVWDFIVSFGQLKHIPPGTQAIEWNTSVTMPWAVAKTMAYFTFLNVVSEEMDRKSGIDTPDAMVPKPPPVPTQDSSARVWKFYNLATDIYEILFRTTVERALPPPSGETIQG